MFNLDSIVNKYLFKPNTEETREAMKKEIEEVSGKLADIAVDNSVVHVSLKDETDIPRYVSTSGTIPFINTYTTDFKTVALPDSYLNRISLSDYAECSYYPGTELENEYYNAKYYNPREDLEEENRSLKEEIEKLKKQLGEIIE